MLAVHIILALCILSRSKCVCSYTAHGCSYTCYTDSILVVVYVQCICSYYAVVATYTLSVDVPAGLHSIRHLSIHYRVTLILLSSFTLFVHVASYGRIQAVGYSSPLVHCIYIYPMHVPVP